jgi:hypothetical protein
MTSDVTRVFPSRGSIAAGKLTAMGLETIREKLGPKWEKLSALVDTLFEAAIKRSCKPGDAYFKTGELNFVLLFRDLSLQDAQHKCTEIAKEVCNRLYGEQTLAMAVRNLVGPVDREYLPAYRNIEFGIDEALERGGTETVICADNAPAPVLSAPAATREMDLSFTQHPRIRVPWTEDSLTFNYRPIWDCTLKVVLTYLCQPIVKNQLGVSSMPGFCTAARDEDRGCLDRAVLAHAVKRIQQMRTEGARVLLAVPLHFTTLARQRIWADFNKLYGTLSHDILRDVIFVILDLEGVPNIRLTQELPKLSGARHIMCAIHHNDRIGERFANTGVHAFGLEFPDAGPSDAELNGCIKSLALDADERGFQSFVLGIQSTSRALNAMAAGVRYLEGPAIHAPVADPRFAFVHGIEDLYAAQA